MKTLKRLKFLTLSDISPFVSMRFKVTIEHYKRQVVGSVTSEPKTG